MPGPEFDDQKSAREREWAEYEALRSRFERAARQHFPAATTLLDDLRGTFGPGVALQWAIQGDAVLGEPPADIKSHYMADRGLTRLRRLKAPRPPAGRSEKRN